MYPYYIMKRRVNLCCTERDSLMWGGSLASQHLRFVTSSVSSHFKSVCDWTKSQGLMLFALCPLDSYTFFQRPTNAVAHKVHNAFSLLLSEYLQLLTPSSRNLLEEDRRFSKFYPYFLKPKAHYYSHKSRLIVSRVGKIILTKALQSRYLIHIPRPFFFV